MSSAWNQLSGNWSWEERDYSSHAKAQFPGLFEAALARSVDDAACAVTGSVRASEASEASVLVLRGRLRFGYEFDDVRADVCVRRGAETLFDGVVGADALSNDEGDAAAAQTRLAVRTRRAGTDAGAQLACDVVRRALLLAAADLRDALLAKPSHE